MTRDEAKQLLNCSLYELSVRLGVSSAAVAQWTGNIPKLREYQVIELHKKSLEENLNQTEFCGHDCFEENSTCQ